MQKGLFVSLYRQFSIAICVIFLYMQVDRTGTDSIKEAAFVFGYGHTVIAISPSLSLPASFGIGFSWGTEKMVEEAIRMDNKGIITEY